jgi:hypothetical protein
MDNKSYIGTLGRGVLVVVLFSLLSGCSLLRPKVITKIEKEVEYRDREVHDTATVEIPIEVERIVTRDTSSHLENSFAKSDAVVSGGYLHHSLESIPQIIRVPVVVHVTDTIYREKEAVETIKEVKVEKPLSWSQKAKIGAFPWLVIGFLGLLIWATKKWWLRLP